MKLRHLGLFEGIGGFSLAAEWSGWETLAWCEWNPFGQKVLKHHFPKADAHGDITKTDFSIYRGRIDIITGGFPCQPYSLAGKRLGKEDERHLWPQMLRAIREVQPRWVVGENVFGIVNWNGGMVFNEVQSDLEAEGYEVFPYVLPACSVNAPHRRDRVWFVAYSNNNRKSRRASEDEGKSKKERLQKRDSIWQLNESDNVRELLTDTVSLGNTSSGQGTEVEGIRGERIKSKGARGVGCKRIDGLSGLEGYAPDTESGGQGGLRNERETTRAQEGNQSSGSVSGIRDAPDTDSGRQPREEHRQEEPGWITEKGVPDNWSDFPTQPPVRWGNDGIPEGLAGITFPKWRNESIKAYGNAIVPQVAFQIFQAINKYEDSILNESHV